MSATDENLVSITANGVALEGMLAVPPDAPGIVVFAHGSGSSRKSPRNNFVAEVIRERGLGTLLFDLLTEAEDRDRENRFDIPLLTDRPTRRRNRVALVPGGHRRPRRRLLRLEYGCGSGAQGRGQRR